MLAVLDRQKFIGSFKLSHIVPAGESGGVKGVLYAEMHRLPAGQTETHPEVFESLPADYSMMMPFIVKALLEKHGPREPLRLYEKRDALVETLRGAVRENRDWLIDSMHYPLARV